MAVTIKDVARLADTSVTAVSFVLNDKAQGMVSQAVQKRIQKVIRDTGYRRYNAAAGLRLNRSFTVGLCVPERLRRMPLLGHLSHHDLVNRLGHHLHRAGYGVGVIEIGRHPEESAPRLRNEPLDGYMAVQFRGDELEAVTKLLQKNDVPVLLVDAWDQADTYPAPMIGIDREASFARATCFLLDQGRRRVAMLDLSLPSTLTPIKQRGYEKAMRDAGLEPLPLYDIDSPDVAGLKRAVTQMLSEQPTLEGVVLTDNFLAPVAQLLIPQPDIRIVGFGDEAPAMCCDPPLTYMRLPIDALAQQAVETLLGQLDPAPTVAEKNELHCDLIKANL